MSLRAIYTAYLAAPSTGAFAEGASINYIPTLTTINEPTAILRHLAAQQKLLKKKSERIVSAIEGPSGLCVETETTIEFLSGGGAILPGLDDNFLSDRTVTLPIVHIVQFDARQKIEHIRLYWDQGSLLKQVDVIGARAKNWPIRDGKDQIRLITKTSTGDQNAAPGTSYSSHAPAASFSRRSTQSSTNEVSANSRSRGSTASATGDPHATLSLFAPRDVNAEPEDSRRSGAPSYARASSAKPPSRDLTDILAAPEDGGPDSPQGRSRSPSKAGSQKNYSRIRLFDHDGPEEAPSPAKETKKYNHFEFGNGEEAAKAKANANGKHQAQWGFEDFVTPDKVKSKPRNPDMRTMSWEDPEEQQGDKSPVFRNAVHRARPDAETHFGFSDENTPKADKPKPRLGKDGNMGLYNDNVTDRAETAKKPLATGTNVSGVDRARDFGAHYEIADSSPSVARGSSGGLAEPEKRTLDANQAKVLKGLNSNWNMFDEAEIADTKENVPKQRGIKTANDGMGGRKALEEAEVVSKKESAPAQRGIKTANDGMGGRKSSARHWGIGDESGDDEPIKHKPTRAAKVEDSAGGRFWEF